MNLFIISYVYKWAFLASFESKNFFVFCTRLTRSERLIIIQTKVYINRLPVLKRSWLNSLHNVCIYIRKQEGLYQNKVNCSLVFILNVNWAIGVIDCEQHLAFVLNHSRSRARVRGERRSREEWGRKQNNLTNNRPRAAALLRTHSTYPSS